LSVYDPAKLAVPTILDATRKLARVDDVVRPGEPLPKEIVERARAAAREPSRVALAAAAFFREVSDEIQVASEGRFDLGMLTTVGSAAPGAAEIAVTGQLPLPPWSQLAWWAFRTFTTVEEDALEMDAD